MKTVLNISMALIILFSTATLSAKTKKSAKSKDSNKSATVAEPNKLAAPVIEPKVSVEKTKPAVAEPNIPVVDPNQLSAVAVVVNGTKITEGQIEKLLDMRMKQVAGRIPEKMIPEYRQRLRKNVIEQLVVEDLLAQKEREKNIAVSQTELDEKIKEQMAERNLTPDEFKSLLKAYNTNYSEYEQNMRKGIMFEKLMETEFAGKIKEPNDAEIKAYYDENSQQFQEPEKIHVKHILITPAKDANDPNKAKAEAKAKAEDLLKQLKAGADFNDLAKQNSSCPSAKNGGDLGEAPKGSFVPEFEKAAYALKPGELSDVVETQFGYHIIKLVKHIDANTTSLAQAKEDIKKTLTDKQKRDLVINYIQNLKREADIKFTNPADNFEAPDPKPTMRTRTASPDKNEPNNKK